MKSFVLVVFCFGLAISLPQGYNYKEVGPVDLNIGGFKPSLGAGAPCSHGPALAQQQSIGRIINHDHHNGVGSDSQAVTVNSHIVVGDKGHSHSQVFREGQGYVEQGRPQALPLTLHQGPSLPLPGPAPPFIQSGHQSFGSSQTSFSHGHGGSLVNGIGRVPGPSQVLSGGYHNAGSSGFGGQNRPVFTGSSVNANFISGGGRPIGGGYQGQNYQNAGSFQSHSSHGSSQFQSGGGFGQQHSGGFSQGSGSQPFGNFGGASVLNGALGNVIRETFANAPLDPTVEKHIYVHVPPEDLEEKQSHQQLRLPEAAPKKHYKIIFIKAPSVSQPTNYAQLASAGGLSEEKTIVYVLVKKPDEPSINELQQIQQTIKPSKPEVYFIKYKTRNEQVQSGGFIGDNYNSNIEQVGGGGQHIESIGSNQFAGSDVNGGIDVRVNGAASGIESTQSGGSILTSGGSSSSSSSSTSYTSTGSGSVNIGETNTPHEVYGVPSVPSV